MPNKKSIVEKRQSQNKASCKYRRKQTLLNKIKQFAEKSGFNLNLLIEDKQFNKITQFTTHESVKIENVMNRLNEAEGIAPG